MVGNCERQLGDDYGLQCVARHVDTLPEAVGAKQDGPRISFELLEQLRPRCAIGLAQEAKVARGEPSLQARCHTAEHVVTCEQNKRPTIRAPSVFLNRLNTCLFVIAALGARRVRHVADCDKLDLLPIVEWTSNLDLIALSEPHPRLE